MTTLADVADVLRSKNAGPFELTIDLLFERAQQFRRVLDSGVLTRSSVAAAYGVPEDTVRITVVAGVQAIKVTFPRPGPSSGAPADTDVYGAQQHAPLARLEL